MATDDDLIAVWQKAGYDLGFEVHSPHAVRSEFFPALVRMFGRPAGTLPIWLGDQRSRRDAESAGYFVSLLNPEVYCKYDRAQFIETLVDWGWFGAPDEAPKWYNEEVAKLLG